MYNPTEPLLSGCRCGPPFDLFPRPAGGSGERDEPLAKRGEGECDGFALSLSRRIVSSDVRLRFDI